MASLPSDGQNVVAHDDLKRKREQDEYDTKVDKKQFLAPEEDDPNVDNDDDKDSTYTPNGNDGDVDNQDLADDDNDPDRYEEDDATIIIYDESQELFPAYAIFDAEIDRVKKRLTSIPEQVLNILQEDDIQSNLLETHMAKAKDICSFPETDRVRIAILGSAGVGKSSLLNAVTNIPGLAKSVFLTSSLT
jgi:hypothetical protein